MCRLKILLFLILLLFPLRGFSLSLEEGLKIVADTGRDVKIARSDEEVARLLAHNGALAHELGGRSPIGPVPARRGSPPAPSGSPG